MEIKAKKCKGTGKATGHGCFTLQPRRVYGLGIECGCYPKWLYGTEEGKKKQRNSIIQSKKKVTKEVAAKQRAFKLANKSVQAIIKETRIPFQQYVRARDVNEACISCGRVNVDIWDAGHYFKAELYSGLIFDEDNVHKQCRKCNSYLEGNLNAYKERLITKIGQDAFLKLSERAKQLKGYKYTKDELNELKRLYKDKLKQLKRCM